MPTINKFEHERKNQEEKDRIVNLHNIVIKRRQYTRMEKERRASGAKKKL